MKRREFFEKAGLASVAVAALPVAAVGANAAGHQHAAVAGPLANATVSFGQWAASAAAPLDRFPNFSAPVRPNGHQLIPHEVTIKAGGTVNFVIAGFHLVLVYDDGTEPGDIDTSLTIPPTNQPAPPLINDPDRRIYRGLDPSLQPQDRVEVVQFHESGRYLAMCGVLPHFANDGMYGFVVVLP